jgi:hypothetical protein
MVARNGECLATVMGFDNREVLPPFFPLLRGEDNLFGLMLACCDATSLIGHLPFVVIHAPPGQRRHSATTIEVVSVCELIGWLCLMWSRGCEFNDIKSRLVSLGRFLTGTASLPREDFESGLCEVLEIRSRHLTQQLEQYIRVSFLPDVFKASIKREIDSLTKNPTFNVTAVEPRGALHPNATRRSGTLIKDLILKYGQLLKWWIPLLEVAQELANTGMRVGKRLV